MAKNRAGLVELPAEQGAAAQGGANEPGRVQAAPPDLRRYRVSLKHSPTAEVLARHPAEAQAKYVARMSLRSTVHAFQIDDVTEPLPEPEPEAPAAVPIEPDPVVIE